MCFRKKVNITEQEFVRQFCKRVEKTWFEHVAEQAKDMHRLYTRDMTYRLDFIMVSRVGIWPDRMEFEIAGRGKVFGIKFKDYGIRKLDIVARREIAEYLDDKITYKFSRAVSPYGEVKGNTDRVENVANYYLDYRCDPYEFRFMDKIHLFLKQALEE